jgi:hypothetical protein
LDLAVCVFKKIRYEHRLGVSGVGGADALICRVFHGTIGVTDLGAGDARNLLQVMFGTLEAPARQYNLPLAVLRRVNYFLKQVLLLQFRQLLRVI